MRTRLYLNFALAPAAALLLTLGAGAARAQDAAKSKSESPAAASSAKPSEDEKALAVLARAFEVMGGRAYSDVKSITSSGYFTPFQGGVGVLPIKFQDYTVFPRPRADGVQRRGRQEHAGQRARRRLGRRP